MSELAVRAEGNLATSAPSFIDFGGMSMDQKWQMLEKLSQSNLVPQNYRGKPVDMMICADLAQSVGLSFAQGLQNIAVINGRPSIWGDGMIGLVRANPVCEWIEEVEIGEPGTDTYGWRCTAKRRGDPKLVSNTFTIRQAKVAKLLGKDGPWQNYPERMVKMRARSWTCRDGFADVLKGLAMREEIVDVPAEVRAEIVNAPTRADALKAALRATTAVAAAAAATDAVPEGSVAAAPAEQVAPQHVEPTTAERIEAALNAAASQDPDFAPMAGGLIRDYVNGEAAGRQVSEAELRAIEKATPEGKLARANVASVLRQLRELAMTRVPDVAEDEIPEVAPEPVDETARALSGDLVDEDEPDEARRVAAVPNAFDLRKIVTIAANENRTTAKRLAVIERAFAPNGLTSDNLQQVLDEIRKPASIAS